MQTNLEAGSGMSQAKLVVQGNLSFLELLVLLTALSLPAEFTPQLFIPLSPAAFLPQPQEHFTSQRSTNELNIHIYIYTHRPQSKLFGNLAIQQNTCRDGILDAWKRSSSLP